MNRLGRLLEIVAGTFFVGLGALGIFVPLLPTTPFLLLAAFLYARSSGRMYRWLLSHPWLGDFIRAYREGRAMSHRDKVVMIILLWLSSGLTASLATSSWWVRGVLLAVAVGVTTHLLLLRGAPHRRAARQDSSGKSPELETD